MWVEFSVNEIERMTAHGIAIDRNKVNQGITPVEYGDGFTPADRDANAFVGECAAGQVLDLPVNWDIIPFGDGGFDLRGDHGERVECKTIQLPTYRYLILERSEGRTPDFYIVMRGFVQKQGQLTGATKVEVLGWTTRAFIWSAGRFVKQGEHPTTRYGDRQVMPITELSAVPELRGLLHHR